MLKFSCNCIVFLLKCSDILAIILSCACDLHIITSGYMERIDFQAILLSKYIDSGYLVSATP